jgi:hypothetical protein
MSLRAMREEKETKDSISEVLTTKRVGETRGSGTFFRFRIASSGVCVKPIGTIKVSDHDHGLLLRHRKWRVHRRACLRVLELSA